MNLRDYDNSAYQRGVTKGFELLWMIMQSAIFCTSMPGSAWRRGVLRMFGARIGKRVVIKPRVRIKFPWKLSIGDDSWLGEGTWIDNVGKVIIHDNVCISQGVYICTGSHDWTARNFDLVVKEVEINAHSWLCAYSSVAPGANVDVGAVLAFGSVANKPLSSWSIYGGNPATKLRDRVMVPTKNLGTLVTDKIVLDLIDGSDPVETA